MMKLHFKNPNTDFDIIIRTLAFHSWSGLVLWIVNLLVNLLITSVKFWTNASCIHGMMARGR